MLDYFTAMPFLLTFQLLASIVTPALAYPLASNNTLEEGLVRRTDAPQSSSKSHKVHPCHLTQFSSTSTELYRTTSGGTLQDCATHKDNGEMGIAFWPSHPSPVVTCGLVWPNMHLPGNQGAKVGTCFSGPQDPTDISKGLSPCKPGFEEKKSPFYGRPFNTDSRVMQLKDCRKQYDGSVWRLGKKCTMLPSTERDLGGSFGECFVYNEAWYREWYLRQVVGADGEKRKWWNKKREETAKAGGGDWIELDLSRGILSSK